jgi:hypothetical protein
MIKMIGRKEAVVLEPNPVYHINPVKNPSGNSVNLEKFGNLVLIP